MNENEKNEVMVEQETTQEPEIYYEEGRSGMSTGVAMLIGSGLTLAAIAVGKKLKKVYDNIKASKAEKPEVVEDEVVEGESDNG